MKFCLRNNIPVILLSGRGEFFGAIESTGNENVVLQQHQFARLADDQFVFDTARRIVDGKIANCRALLQRRGRTRAAAADERITRAVAAIEEIKKKLSSAGTIDEVRGYEGAAAARYYEALGACFSPPFEFKGRTRRPPLDPVNALLSFGYTLLFYNIYAIARGRGLSPYVGTLHSIRQGHPALCSDLIEEFRAPVVDALVTTLLNKRIIGQGDFHFAETSSGARGCFLTDQARRTFITQFEQRINTLVRHPLAGVNTTWRGCIDIQVGHYVQLLRGSAPAYLPIEMR
jgi:CRISPR-associated protein Cas1